MILMQKQQTTSVPCGSFADGVERTLLSAAFDMPVSAPNPCHSDRSRSVSDGGVEEPAVLPEPLHETQNPFEPRLPPQDRRSTVEERRFSAA